jgi:hypothetical protein
MPESQLTVAMLAGLEPDPILPGLSETERRKLVTTLRDEARKIPLLAPFDVGERLLGVLAKALQKPIAEVLADVWKQREEMRDAAAKSIVAHTSMAEVELYEHTISWAVHPTLKITVNGMSTTLRFDVKWKGGLEGAKIVIERAHITKFLAGKLTSTMNLELKSFPLMAPVKRTIDLPGQFKLPGGGINLSGITDVAAPASSSTSAEPVPLVK